LDIDDQPVAVLHQVRWPSLVLFVSAHPDSQGWGITVDIRRIRY